MNKRIQFHLICIVIVSMIIAGCNISSPASPTATSEPTTGTITGKILRADGKPLVNAFGDEDGYVILYCPVDNNSKGECLHEEDAQKDASEIIASICEIGDISSNCKLHLWIGATPLVADGSYVFPAVFPGKYELVLIIISNGIAITIHLINVDPVQAGKTVEYNFTTK